MLHLSTPPRQLSLLESLLVTARANSVVFERLVSCGYTRFPRANTTRIGTWP